MDSCTVVSIICAILGLYLGADVAAYADMHLLKSVLLRGVSIICIFAFTSVHLQLSGLVGERGLVPLGQTLDTLKGYVGTLSDRQVPWYRLDKLMAFMLTIVHSKYCEKNEPAQHLDKITVSDIVMAVLSLVYPHPAIFVYLYVSYFSTKRLGGPFYNFQWDALLLEVLALATLLTMSYDRVTTAISINLMKVLLFRLMFGSGVVKYFSGDASWHTNYTAMAYHFLTQPLPNVLGMYVHTKTPTAMFQGMTIGTLVMEGVVPLMSLLNLRLVNYFTAMVYVLLQASIALTGYYGFFNYLTMVLSLSLLDDSAVTTFMHCCLRAPLVSRLLEVISLHSWFSSKRFEVTALSTLGLLSRCLATCLFYPTVLLVLCSNVAALYLLVERTGLVKNPLSEACLPHCSDAPAVTPVTGDVLGCSSLLSVTGLHRALHIAGDTAYVSLHAAFRHLLVLHSTLMHVFFLGSHYGLFANMTKVRNEVVVELSHDKVHWQTVEFLAKPGNIDLPPKSVRPFFHLPRLDWVMWFVAFKPVKELYPKWFWLFVITLMEGDNAAVLKLLHPTRNDGIVTHRGGDNSSPTVFQYARVSLVNYRFAGRVENPAAPEPVSPLADVVLSSPASSSSPSSPVPSVERTAGRYWSSLPVRVILPPTSLAELYVFLDEYDEGLKRHRATRAPPSAETAKDIIMRTLFGKLKGKKKQQ